jgi:hypothetical protein
VTELNAEYVESVVKLGLIERKKAVLLSIGAAATMASVEDTFYWLQMHEQIDALIRDPKKLRQVAEGVVKASKS